MLEKTDITEVTAENLGEIERDELVPFTAEYSEKQIKIRCTGCGQKLDVTDLEPFQRIACPVCGAALTVPLRFDRYMLEKTIHEYDGMFKIYRGFDMVLERTVIVKVLKPALAEIPEKCDAFLREAVAVAAINHFAVAPVYNCGRMHAIPYVVTQYLEGGTLENHLCRNSSAIPVEQAVKWVSDIASGLSCAAKLGILHRDVRPANLLLTGDLHIKLCDFAIDLIPGISLEQSRDIYGRYHYANPERIQGKTETHASDIFSLGVLFYHLLSRRMPYSGGTAEAVLKCRLRRPAASLPNTVPKELREMVAKMLSPNPDKRCTGEEISEKLNNFLASEARLKRHTYKDAKDGSPEAFLREEGMFPSRKTALAFVCAMFLLTLGGLFWLCLRHFLAYMPR